jgi:hypothetical protein
MGLPKVVRALFIFIVNGLGVSAFAATLMQAEFKNVIEVSLSLFVGLTLAVILFFISLFIWVVLE